MEKIYLLKREKIMLGPYSVDALKQKGLKSSDLVWYEGLADWTPAGNIVEFDWVVDQPEPEVVHHKLNFKDLLKRVFSMRR